MSFGDYQQRTHGKGKTLGNSLVQHDKDEADDDNAAAVVACHGNDNNTHSEDRIIEVAHYY